MRKQYTCGIDPTRGVLHQPIADDNHDSILYEFVGNISDYDLPNLVNENNELEDLGYIAEELLRDALLHYNSTLFEAEKRIEVFNLLKHIFDPNDTVFCGGPFHVRYFENSSWGGRLLM